MHTESARLIFYIPSATSLKHKRQVCRSLIDKTKQRFNVSIAEVASQDVHQTLTIGIAIVSGTANHAEQSLAAVIRYLEEHASAELVNIEVGH